MSNFESLDSRVFFYGGIKLSIVFKIVYKSIHLVNIKISNIVQYTKHSLYHLFFFFSLEGRIDWIKYVSLNYWTLSDFHLIDYLVCQVTLTWDSYGFLSL